MSWINFLYTTEFVSKIHNIYCDIVNLHISEKEIYFVLLLHDYSSVSPSRVCNSIVFSPVINVLSYYALKSGR